MILSCPTKSMTISFFCDLKACVLIHVDLRLPAAAISKAHRSWAQRDGGAGADLASGGARFVLGSNNSYIRHYGMI